MNVITTEGLQIAKEMGFTQWLDNTPQRGGWHKDLMGGKAVRGAQAADMLTAQENAVQAINERITEIAQAERQQELMATIEADIQMEIDMDEELEAFDEDAEDMQSDEAVAQAIIENMDAEHEIIGEIRTGRLREHIAAKVLVEGKAPKTTIINCVDCNSEREIKVQDAFQVTRCVSCQKKHRNKIRTQRRKEKRQEERAQAKA